MKKIISVILFITITLQFCCFAVEDIKHTNQQSVKVLFDNDFPLYKSRDDKKGARISGWDINDAGGRILDAAYLQILDTSNIFPVEATRKFEWVGEGKIMLEMSASTAESLEGGVFTLRNGTEKVITLYMENGHLLYDGNLLFPITGSGVWYNIRINADFDTKAFEIRLNDKQVYSGNLNESQLCGVDNFHISTGAKEQGRISFSSIKMYAGYSVFEEFSTGCLPDDWTLYKGSSVMTGEYTPVLNSTDNITKLKKYFDPLNSSTVIEFEMLQSAKRDFSVRICDDTKAAVILGTKERTSDDKIVFYIRSRTYSHPTTGQYCYFYDDYLENMWYTVRLIIYPETQTADVYLNGKLKCTDFPFYTQTDSVDNIEFYLSKDTSGATVELDNISVYPYEEFADYVPKPQKITSPDYTIGMQQCPLWEEGRFWGYDWLCDSETRKPVLGFYDESSAEAMDWNIKFMAEHGIDFQWIVMNMYGNVDTPYKPDDLPYMIHDGYFYAKYSDMVKFAVLWENAAVNNWTSDKAYNREMFLKYTVPFWIEYYFKDNRYQTVGGRPLLGIYHFPSFSNAFGTPAEVSEMIDKMGEICEQSGVGRPYIILGTYTVDFNSGSMSRYKSYGADASYSYNMGTNMPDKQMALHMKGFEAAKSISGGYNYIPTVTNGWDSFIWSGASTGHIECADFDRYMQDFHTGVMPGAAKIEGEKPLIMCGSWNELGEGHYLMPTEADGFGYVDAIRTHLAGGGEHEDAVPTANQADRINNRYPAERKTQRTEKFFPLELPESAVVKQQITAWSAVDRSCTVSQDESGIKITPRQDNAVIEVNDIKTDIFDTPYIRLKFTNSTNADSVSVYYTTDYAATIDNRRSMKAHIKNKNEVVIPLGTHLKEWQGTLGTLRLSFDNSGIGNSIILHSAELISVPDNDNYIMLDNRRYDLMKPIKNDMIAISQIAEAIGDRFYTCKDYAALKRRDDGQLAELTCDGVKVNGATIGPATGWYTKGDDLYATPEIASVLLGREVSIQNGNVIITRHSDNSQLLFAEEFNTDEMTFAYQNIPSCKIVDGKAVINTSAKGDPFLINTNLIDYGIRGRDIESIKFKIKSTCDYEGQLFYVTDTTTGYYTEEQSVKYPVFAGEREYTLTLTNRNLEGNLRGIRFDLGNNTENQIELDYIRILKKVPVKSYYDTATPLDGMKNVSVTDTLSYYLTDAPKSVGTVREANGKLDIKNVTLSDKGITLNVSGMKQGTSYKIIFDDINYDTFSTSEVWKFTTKISPYEVFGEEFESHLTSGYIHWGGGYLSANASDGLWNIYRPAGANTYFYLHSIRGNIENVRYMNIRVKSEYPITGKIYFATDASPSASEDKTFLYGISGNGWDYITIPVYEHSLWSGNLTNFRMDFSNAQADNKVSVDFVRFTSEKPISGEIICGEHTSEEYNGGEITGHYALFNNSKEIKNIDLFEAGYTGEKLSHISKQQIRLEPGETAQIAAYKNPYEKLFIWQSDNLSPVCDCGLQ